MELLGSSLCKPWQAHKMALVLRHLYGARLCSSSSTPVTDSLFNRISPLGHPSVSMVPILDDWARQGLPISPDELSVIVKRLVNFRRFSHALQVIEWSEKMSIKMSKMDISRKLDLISRVRGVKQAEEYFQSHPPGLRSSHMYYALLSCYVNVRSLEKAENFFHELDEIGLTRISVPYNLMVRLYCLLKMYEKADNLMQEMEKRDIQWDKFTYSIRLNAYAVACDVRGMELLLRKMEGDPWCKVNWVTYSVAASGYLNAGLVDESVAMIKRVEKLGIKRADKLAYATLLTLYGRAGKKNDVYRIWNLHKSYSPELNNKCYLHVVSSLVKADDIEGAEKIYEEYSSQAKNFDYRIANMLVRGYGNKGNMEKAQAMAMKGIEEHGKEPQMSTWDILAAGYCKNNRMEDALEAFKKAVVADRRGWRLNRWTMMKCLDYLKEKGDLREVEELTSLVGDGASSAEKTMFNGNLMDGNEHEEMLKFDGPSVY